MNRTLKILVSPWIFVVCASGLVAQTQNENSVDKAHEPATSQKIESLIKDLDSKNFQVRQTATAALIKLGRPAIRQLAENVLLRKSESSSRSAFILREIGKQTGEQSHLKIIRLLDAIERAGFPRSIDDIDEFRTKWQDNFYSDFHSKVRDAGITLHPNKRDLLELFDKEKLRAAESNDKEQHSDKQVLVDITIRGKQYSSVYFDATGNTTPRFPAPSPAQEIVIICNATIDKDIAAVEAIKRRRIREQEIQANKIENSKNDSEERDDSGEIIVLERRVVVDFIVESGSIKDFHNSEESLKKPKFSIDESSDLAKCVLLFRTMEHIDSVYVFNREIPEYFLTALSDHPSINEICFCQCRLQIGVLKKLSDSQPKCRFTIDGEATLGVYCPDCTLAKKDQFKCLVTHISPLSPAYTAGIRSGDIIVGLDDKEIDCFRNLQIELLSKQPGETVSVDYQRENKKMTVDVILGARN